MFPSRVRFSPVSNLVPTNHFARGPLAPLVQCKASQPNTLQGGKTAGSKPKHTIRICTNKTCKKQGSQQIEKFARDLALEEIDIETCGCLGVCGNGPNMAILPQGQQLSHVSSPAKFAEVLDLFCNIPVSPKLLKATELRLQGNAEARCGDLPAAIRLYTQAIDLDPPHGKHLLLANRAGAKLGLKDVAGAVEDASAAVAVAPTGFTTGYIRLIEALAADGQYTQASSVLQDAATKEPAFAKTSEFRSIQSQLSKLLKR